MIERIWSGKSAWYLFLLPLSWLYGLVTALIRLSYRLGWRKTWRAPVPVVVVGNLTAGGNGKTPVVIWLVEQLQRHGIRVGVVSRGYGGHAGHYPLVVTDDTTSAEAGDEPLLIHQRTGAAVAVAPDRGAAIRALLASSPLQIIITDDGLQHYALQRDVEIVVIDGVRRFGNGWWLPAGPMRERAARLKTVDAVMVNGGVAQGSEIAMHLVPGEAVQLATGKRCALSQLGDVVAMAGIGHPPRFFATLQQQGVTISRAVALADHQALSEQAVAGLVQPGQRLLMTEKDAVKYRTYAQRHPDWWYLPVDAHFEGAAANQLVAALVKSVRAH